MSKMAWKPDENGVPMSNCDKCGRADECDEAWHGSYCYPKMVEIVAAIAKMSHRICHDCGNDDYYTDNILPACACSKCGSADTRLVRVSP